MNKQEFSGHCWSHTEAFTIKAVVLQGPPGALHGVMIGEKDGQIDGQEVCSMGTKKG